MSTHLMSLLQAIHSVIYVHTQVKKIYYSRALASHFGHFDEQALLKHKISQCMISTVTFRYRNYMMALVPDLWQMQGWGW